MLDAYIIEEIKKQEEERRRREDEGRRLRLPLPERSPGFPDYEIPFEDDDRGVVYIPLNYDDEPTNNVAKTYINF